MYPRVRVRMEEQEDSLPLPYDGDSFSFPAVLRKAPSSPSPRSSLGLRLAVERNQKKPNPPSAKNTETCVPRLAIPLIPISVSNNAKCHRSGPRKISIIHTEKLREDTGHSTGARSVSRPRAVVSSPDNDKLIGYQNKLISKRQLAFEAQSPDQISPSRIKVKPFLPRKEESHSSKTPAYKEAVHGKTSMEDYNAKIPSHKAFVPRGKGI
ncbi:hypothetical protein NMG60_11014157 [Bertholletia excelsa]